MAVDPQDASRAGAHLQGRAAVQTIWQLIASGGWWKPREIAESLGLTLRTTHSRLTGMAACGYLVRRQISPELRVRLKPMGRLESVEYSVTDRCIVPGGMTAKQVIDALQGPAE